MELVLKSRIRNLVKEVAFVILRILGDLVGILKVLIKSNFSSNDLSKIRAAGSNEFVFICNGPSLNDTLKEDLDFFNGKTIGCMNEFVLSDYFVKIKPAFYIFMDPGIWTKSVSNRIQDLLKKDHENFRKNVTWPMVLLLPLCAKKWNWFMDLPRLNKNIRICYVNTTTVNCSKWLRNFLYSKNLAMPAVVNTLIGALFLSVNLGYKKIFIVGADHSWHENIYVGKDNVVYLKDEHFYFEKNLSLSPLLLGPEETENVKIHVLFKAISQAFEAYHEIAEYAKYAGVKIYNASKKTYIDAFERYVA